MSDFIFTDDESQAQANPAEPAMAPKKRRAPAKKKATKADAPKQSKPSPAARPIVRQSASSRSGSAGNSTAWLVIFICLLVVAAYFAYQYYGLKNSDSAAMSEASQEPSPESSTPANAENSDPAANWLAYSYPEVAASSSATSTASDTPAFSLKYPTNTKINKTDKRLVFEITGATSTSFIVSWEKSAKDLPAYLKEIDRISAKSWEGKPAVKIETSTEAVMAEKYPAVLRQQKMLAADLSQYVAYIKASSTVYAVSLIAPALTDNEAAAFSIFLNNFKILK